MWRKQPTEEFPIEEYFPRLTQAGYTQTSPIDFNQNRFGYALGRYEWWEAGRGSRWPKDVPDDTVAGWIEVLKHFGFSIANDGSLESGIEKVALYTRNEEPLHIARQDVDGAWESKLGWGWDIKHQTYDSIEGDAYGRVTVFMQRGRKL